MSRISRITRRTACAVAIAVAGVGVATVEDDSPVQAAGWSATLSVLRYNPYNYYWLAVEGLIPMSQWDAQGYINNGATMELRLWGADWPDGDDFLYGPYFWGGGSGGGSGQMWADAAGLHFFRTVLLPGSTLNEDSGPRSQDEIYVDAKFIDGDGASSHAHTNEVDGYF
jgi:hypothetical protein